MRTLESLQRCRPLEVSLLFDSGPIQDGRARSSPTELFRHMLFRAGNLCLDLRLETASGSTQATGQLSASNDPLTPAVQHEVVLVTNQVITTRSSSDRNGEFGLTFDPSRPTLLLVPMERDRILSLPIADAAMGAVLEGIEKAYY